MTVVKIILGIGVIFSILRPLKMKQLVEAVILPVVILTLLSVLAVIWSPVIMIFAIDKILKKREKRPPITFKPVNISKDEWLRFCKESEEVAKRATDFVNRNYSPSRF